MIYTMLLQLLPFQLVFLIIYFNITKLLSIEILNIILIKFLIQSTTKFFSYYKFIYMEMEMEIYLNFLSFSRSKIMKM